MSLFFVSYCRFCDVLSFIRHIFTCRLLHYGRLARTNFFSVVTLNFILFRFNTVRRQTRILKKSIFFERRVTYNERIIYFSSLHTVFVLKRYNKIVWYTTLHTHTNEICAFHRKTGKILHIFEKLKYNGRMMITRQLYFWNSSNKVVKHFNNLNSLFWFSRSKKIIRNRKTKRI